MLSHLLIEAGVIYAWLRRCRLVFGYRTPFDICVVLESVKSNISPRGVLLWNLLNTQHTCSSTLPRPIQSFIYCTLNLVGCKLTAATFCFGRSHDWLLRCGLIAAGS